MMRQVDAVHAAVTNVLRSKNISFEDGQNAHDKITPEIRHTIVEIIVESFIAGKTSLKDTPENREKLADRTKLTMYVGGLVCNWLRKDPRLNGGKKYEAKNPGSRTGAGDAQLKALKELHKQFSAVDPAKAKSVQRAIDARISEIQKEKAKNIEIDLSVLPEELIEELGLNNDSKE